MYNTKIQKYKTSNKGSHTASLAPSFLLSKKIYLLFMNELCCEVLSVTELCLLLCIFFRSIILQMKSTSQYFVVLLTQEPISQCKCNNWAVFPKAFKYESLCYSLYMSLIFHYEPFSILQQFVFLISIFLQTLSWNCFFPAIFLKIAFIIIHHVTMSPRTIRKRFIKDEE